MGLGVVGKWPADGNTNDIVGGNQATLVGGATFAPGKVGKAFSLDGVDDWVSIKLKNTPTGDAPHSIAAWLNPKSLPSKRSWILLWGNPGTGSHHWLQISAGNTQFGPWNGSQVTPPLPINKWTHVAMTYDGKSLKSYVNGALTQTKTISSPKFKLNDSLVLGKPMVGGESWYAGLIDQLAIYDRALNAGDVKVLFEQETALSDLEANGNNSSAVSGSNVRIVDWPVLTQARTGGNSWDSAGSVELVLKKPAKVFVTVQASIQGKVNVQFGINTDERTPPKNWQWHPRTNQSVQHVVAIETLTLKAGRHNIHLMVNPQGKVSYGPRHFSAIVVED